MHGAYGRGVRCTELLISETGFYSVLLACMDSVSIGCVGCYEGGYTMKQCSRAYFRVNREIYRVCIVYVGGTMLRLQKFCW